MQFRTPPIFKLLVAFIIIGATFYSCQRKNDTYAFEGTVLNINGDPVVDAKVEVFTTPHDWLTGHNVIASMTTNLRGNYKSNPIYEEGKYYLFIEKYDSSNWEIRDVERSIYPSVNLPLDGPIKSVIEQSNMSLLANTKWKITNILKEFSRNNHQDVEWISNWSKLNNCDKDNQLFFGKDLSLRIYEGNSICSGKKENILTTYVPPIIFSDLGCESLTNSTQKVKEFEVENWEGLEYINAKFYLDCNQSLGQLYIIFENGNGGLELHVYKKF